MITIVEIQAQDNGAHRNCTSEFCAIPDGYAVIPDDLETPNFPFGEVETKDEDIVEVKKVDGEEVEKVVGTRKVVTKWIAGEIPEVEEEIPAPTEAEKLRADIDFLAIMTGVDL